MGSSNTPARPSAVRPSARSLDLPAAAVVVVFVGANFKCLVSDLPPSRALSRLRAAAASTSSAVAPLALVELAGMEEVGRGVAGARGVDSTENERAVAR